MESSTRCFAGPPVQFCLALVLALTTPAAGADKALRGHVPAAVKELGLRPVGRVPADTRLNLVIGLPIHDVQGLTTLIEQLYNPTSTNFHRYLNPEQFTQRYGPTEQEYQAVIRFASTNELEVRKTYSDRIMLDVSAPVSAIEKAFHLTMLTYQHPSEARQFFAPDVEPSVDTNLPTIFITGLNDFSRPHPMSHVMPPQPSGAFGLGGSGPGGTYQGYDFRNAYLPGVKLTGTGQSVGLLEFEGYYASDIAAYESQAGLPSVPLQNVPLDGFTLLANDTNGIAECSVDIEMVISMAPGISTLYVFEDAYPSTLNPSPDHILASMAASNQIKQFSSSWGWGSFDPTGESYLMQMAGQGQTFFMASGDGDAYSASCGPIPWPSDDLYVTSVGGTILVMTNNGATYLREIVWNSGPLPSKWTYNCSSGFWGSGGGSNSSFHIPLWQQGVNLAPAGGSTVWRNIPDVALTAANIWGIYAGTNNSFIGTSTAAPLWAGFTAVVNQQTASLGLSSVGFLNPALYATGLGPNFSSAFNDITNGNNGWFLGTNIVVFNAVSGYDLCTGWGTPNGTNLINALMPYAASVWVDFNYTGADETGTYFQPFKALADGTNYVPLRGSIWIRTAGSSSEKMTISKPLTIRAYNGPATVGH